MFKIAFLGPESSGKTTLAEEMGNQLDAIVIKEYAREYFKDKDYSKCCLKDLEAIAIKQFKDTHDSYPYDFLISDTEILTIEIWAEDKFGVVPEIILNLRRQQDFDLYILTKPDIPWEFDPLRKDANRRDYLFEIYKEHIEKSNYNYIIVEGLFNNRIEVIKNYIDNYV